MSRETYEEQQDREEQDNIVMEGLEVLSDPFKNESALPCVRVRGQLFSWRWILHYWRARQNGVTCRATSSWHANVALNSRGSNENHSVVDRRMDYQLLWHAHMRQFAKGKRPKGGRP